MNKVVSDNNLNEDMILICLNKNTSDQGSFILFLQIDKLIFNTKGKLETI